MHNELRQAWEEKYNMISLACGIFFKNKKNNSFQEPDVLGFSEMFVK